MRRALLVLPLLILAVAAQAQTTHDIRGTWDVEIEVISNTTSDTWRFATLDKASGEFTGTWTRGDFSGTVDGDQLTGTAINADTAVRSQFTGTINADTDAMSGIWRNSVGESGRWRATRVNGPPPPPPKPGKNANVAVREGEIKYRRKGSSKFVTLGKDQQLPVGSEVDTRKGQVTLTTAVAAGATQSAWFYDGVFKVTQRASGLTELALTGGSFNSCPKARSARASASRKKTIRKLWGDGKGKFRTKGKHSAAVVRGTRWEVRDRCDGTLTTVKSGTVTVTDFRTKKKVTVRAGKSYLARAR